MRNLPSKILAILAMALIAGCGMAVTVNPDFSPQAAGRIDHMLLVIDNQGGLRGLIGGERPVEAIGAAVKEGLSGAGYPIRTPEDLGLGAGEAEALAAGHVPRSALADHSHLLRITLAPVERGRAPTGFSLAVGDSDPRGGQASVRGEVLPVSCALLDGRDLREEAIARSDRAVPKGEEGWRSKTSGPDERVAALAGEIQATCEPLLAELNVARAGGTLAPTTTYGSGIRIEIVPAEEVTKAPAAIPPPVVRSEPPAEGAAPAPSKKAEPARDQAAVAAPAPASVSIATEPSSVSTERATTKTGKKQIRIYNPGGTVILEFGHERR